MPKSAARPRGENVRAKLKMAIVVLALLTSACGTEDSEPTASGKSAPSENRVPVAMAEFAYSMPDDVTGGFVTFEFTNNGDLPHEAAFGEIEEGVDVDEMVKAIEAGDEPKGAKDIAGLPVLDGGATMSMTRELQPGNYVFFCFLPVPKSGAPHVTEGMVHAFEVTGSSDAPAPAADYTVTATNDGFEVPEIAAGTQAVEVVNGGTKPHEFVF
jgi:hypothetical protein